MRQIALALVLSFVAALGPSAQAQDAPAGGGPPMVRVRLRNEDRVQGYLRGRSADEVVVFTGDGRYRRLAMTEIQRFEVRSRAGNQAGRGALIGALVWVGVIAAASRGALDKFGVASWQSGAVLAGSVGAGALAGSRVPRYGWRLTEPSALTALPPVPGVRVTLRF